jgi:cation diffusion facilitator CzcD-associated flavoprotein CzcO
MTDWTDYLSQNSNVTLTGNPRVVIIGAGVSGVCMGAKLTQAGVTNFTILEREGSVGGTWRENRYPGAACDLHAHFYSFTFHRYPNFSSSSAPAAEINAYLDEIVDEFGFRTKIQFRREVLSTIYSEGGWEITTADGSIERADLVVAGCGFLHIPNIPDIEGMGDFKGSLFHSSKWDTDLDIRGKRVANIGNGSSSTQIVPAIVDTVESVTVFQRTAQWILPVPNQPFSDDEQAAYRDDPANLERLYEEQQAEMHATVGQATINEGVPRSEIRRMCEEYLDSVTDPELRRKLQPNYEVMCKRLILTSGYFEALQKPNAYLITEPIERITEKGIETADGVEREFDVIVLSTGFQTHQWARPLGIAGRGGQTLDQAWSEGARSFETTTVAGFPNLFLLGGPFSPIGNTSFMAAAELQATHILKLMKLREERGALAIEPTVAAEERFVDDMHDQSKHTIWRSGCVSWYIDEHGKTDLWVRTPEDFVAMLASGPHEEDYNLVEAVPVSG